MNIDICYRFYLWNNFSLKFATNHSNIDKFEITQKHIELI